MKEKQTVASKSIVPIEDFVRIIREIAGKIGARNPQAIGVGNYEERWRDSLGNEHVVSVTWVTWPKNPLLNFCF